MIGKIELKGLTFHAYHGVYPEERAKGNTFFVDIVIENEFSEKAFDDELAGTIDYQEVYAIVREEMNTQTKLLERVAHQIGKRVLGSFLSAQAVEVKVGKASPPIGGPCDQSAITLTMQR